MLTDKQYFQSLLDYDQISGSFTWKEREKTSRSNNIFNSLFSGKRAGSVHSCKRSKTTYVAIKVGNKTYKAHRIAFILMTGYAPDQVDHIDTNGMNNAWANLRASDSKDNSKNLPIQKSNKTGVIGANWHKSAKKWQARAVNLEGKRIDLGRFDLFEDAVLARKNHEIKFKYFEYRVANVFVEALPAGSG